MRIRLVFIFVFLFAGNSLLAQTSLFTYQGRLAVNGSAASGTYEIRLALYDAMTNGNAVGTALTNSAVAVSDGLFVTTLDFGAGVFSGADRWLEIGVRTNGSASAFQTLSPRQRITSAPYAITAGDVVSANIARLNVPNTATPATGHPVVTSGFITSAVVDNPGAGYSTAPAVTVNANGPGSGAVITATVSNGSVTAFNVVNPGSGYTTSATLTIGAPPPNNYQVFVTSNFFPNVNVFSNPSNVFAGNGAGLSGVWKLSGNTGASPTNGNFLGTADNQPLELKVNGLRALRMEPNTNGAPNMIGGSPVNFVDPGVVGAVIAGGGTVSGDFALGAGSNRVSAIFGTISGGRMNTVAADHSIIGGGYTNTIYPFAYDSVIGGGVANTVQTGGGASVIGGGFGNITSGGSATVGGGANNTASGGNATVGGGGQNTASAYGATVPGGAGNVASGNYSFAVGYTAQAAHQGTFVWADTSAGNFTSSAANQFLIRAVGGVGIGTASPGAQLEVRTTAANANAIRFGYASGGAGNLIAGPSRVSIATDDLIERFAIRQGSGNVGIGLTGPNYQLQLALDSAAKPNGGSWANSSDARLKRNIASLTNALERLTQLRGVTFEWVNAEDHANQRGTQGGFIAQEVEKVFPKWITEVDAAEHDRTLTPDGRIKSLTLPFEFDALVVEAIKEQQQQIKARDRQIAELQHRLDTMEKLVNRLTSAVISQ